MRRKFRNRLVRPKITCCEMRCGERAEVVPRRARHAGGGASLHFVMDDARLKVPRQDAAIAERQRVVVEISVSSSTLAREMIAPSGVKRDSARFLTQGSAKVSQALQHLIDAVAIEHEQRGPERKPRPRACARTSSNVTEKLVGGGSGLATHEPRPEARTGRHRTAQEHRQRDVPLQPKAIDARQATAP